MSNMNAQLGGLSAHEADVWSRFWTVQMQLPAFLDAQLKRDAGVAYFEFHALQKIAESKRKSRRMTDLSEATAMSLSHLSRVVTRLEKKGLVVRIPDPNDGRSTFATLTPEGEKTVKSALPGHTAELRRVLFDNLNSAELEQLAHVFARMNSALVAEPGLNDVAVAPENASVA
ncbi:MarR family transcriptional regulator [Corynebacterium tuscaniense]|uniref:MarR family transcriptional regulator n=1 Tax=Corynebacterium tuscaniense TaxID=302449 RepID=A0A2N6T7X9_9CORY|nr:MarR family transcriptional regulator [Corynebacterium tuscaniense]KAA8737324.1 MarR family transcriptional regulator [Corynebacterium tuscaniense]KGF22102.1 MarR family transcriptional regulator [Corynebacterium tuscaniense DNF00037]PMC65402.1 MarR family transcriptional regulator [Corynebacterium tuscaniense]